MGMNEEVNWAFSNFLVQSRGVMINIHVSNFTCLVHNVSCLIVSTSPIEAPLVALMPPGCSFPKTCVSVKILNVYFTTVTSSN